MTVRNRLVQCVIDLHKRVGYDHPQTSSLGSTNRAGFWLKAIDEEIEELRNSVERNDIVGTADAIGDAVYVLLGAAVAFGLPFEEVFEEIHRSNMTKDVITVDSPDGVERKLVKGMSYKPPEILALLNNDPADSPRSTRDS